ncbi:MAG TPA: histidine kinase dimerization/phosphoacceptor domain -containing protein [Clostridia bacterium]|nr:histidine kinase dimerization/phosphoacceptor domain -containing protein [Clostridia bacterium]
MSIARRYTLYTLLLMLVLTAVFAPLMSLASYRQEYRRVSEQIEQIEHSHIPALVSSLWMTHYKLLQEQIEGIVEFPYIDQVEVIDDEGCLYSVNYRKNPTPQREKMKKYRHTLTYEYRGEEIQLGKLILYVNTRRLRSDVIKGQVPFLLYNLLVALSLAVAVSFLFHMMVGRHLRRFAEFLQSSSDSSSLSRHFSYGRRKSYDDELTQLAEAVNSMRQKLRGQFEEKEMLLREVHHRIKNNISSVQALLKMQADSIDNSDALVALDDAASRLQSMMVLYDKLYRQGMVESMSVAEYLPTLLHEILGVFPGGKKVQLHTEIDNILFDAQELSYLGIMTNELVTNSLKHGFLDQTEGHISVVLRRQSEQKLEFIYRDDGVGVSDSVISGESGGLGFMLIRSMIDQFEGTFEISGKQGILVRILFSH